MPSGVLAASLWVFLVPIGFDSIGSNSSDSDSIDSNEETGE